MKTLDSPRQSRSVDAMRVLVVDDEAIVRETISSYLVDSGCSVVCLEDGPTALGHIRKNEYDLALVDLFLPGMNGMTVLAHMQEYTPAMPVVIITGHGNMDTVLEALRHGAADFLPKPIKLLELDAVLEKCAKLRGMWQEGYRVRAELQGMRRQELGSNGDEPLMVGTSDASQEVVKLVQQAVAADCDTILISGETGTGKEIVAREFHRRRYGSERPFIAVSCPAIPDTLVESELFGHVKGAFTGASGSRAGCFELADGGTLFLDEVADLSAAAQAKLLRVLETRTVRRVGGAQEFDVSVSVIAATNAPLGELVRAGRFRDDLYYRLNVFTIGLLPLRERRDDIIPLATHFLSSYCRPRKRPIDGFDEEASACLRAYDFPGNARELRNIVERAAILCQSGPIGREHLRLENVAPVAVNPATPPPPQDDDADEAARLLAALKKSKWNRKQAAELLGMPYSTLRYKIRTHGLQ